MTATQTDRLGFLSVMEHRVAGADIFISYRKLESQPYAIALRNELEKRHLRCYLDEELLGAGTDIDECKREAARSRMLVIIGTDEIFKSTYVAEELAAYLDGRKGWPKRLWRRIVPINVRGALQQLESKQVPNDLAGTRWAEMAHHAMAKEDADPLANGPSPTVVQKIVRSYDLVRGVVLLTAGGILALLGLTALTLVIISASIAFAVADTKADLAEVEKNLTNKQQELRSKQDELRSKQDELRSAIDSLNANQAELGLVQQQVAHARETLGHVSVARDASGASILAQQFVSELGAHPPNGKERDMRDEQALAAAVDAARPLEKMPAKASESRRAAEDAVTRATADALAAVNYSYRFAGHENANWLRIAGNTGLLISRGHDGEHVIWDPDHPNGARRIVPPGSVHDTALSPNGRFLAVLSESSLDSYEIPSGSRVGEIALDGERVPEPIAISDDGQHVLTQMRDSIEYRNVLNAHVIWRSEGAPACAITFRRDGKTAVLVSTEGVVEILDLTDGRRATGAKIIDRVVGTPVLASDGTAVLWDAFTEDGSGQAKWAARIDPGGMEVSRKHLLDRDHDSGRGEPGFFSPNGVLAAVPGKKGITHVFETDTWEKRFVHTGPPFRLDWIAIDDAASRIVTVSSENFRDGGEVRVWNSALMRPFRELYGPRFNLDDDRALAAASALPFRPTYVASSPDCSTLAAVDQEGVVHAWRQETGLRQLVQTDRTRTASVAVNADGALVLVASGSVVTAFDARTGRKRWTVQGPTGVESDTFLSPSGKWAVTRTRLPDSGASINFAPGAMVVWRVTPNERITPALTIGAPFYQRTHAAVTDDGLTIAVAHNDGLIDVYRREVDAARLIVSHRPPRSEYASADYVGGVRFTRRGDAIRISYNSRNTRLIPIDAKALRTIAERLAAVTSR